MNRMRKPATAGPMMRVRFMPELFRLIAFISLSSGTISESIACRLGILNAIREPLMNPMTIRCQNWTTPVKSSRPMTAVSSTFPVWLTIIRYLRGILSASAPTSGDTVAIGSAKLTMTQVRAVGESFVSLRMSQPRVIICMFIARKETNEPMSIHRKSLYLRDSMSATRLEDDGSASGAAAASVPSGGGGAGSVAAPVRCAKIYTKPVKSDYGKYLQCMDTQVTPATKRGSNCYNARAP